MSDEERRLGRWMTVGDLKRLLADVPDDLRVYTDGCDCVGPSDGIHVCGASTWFGRMDPPYVLIHRNDALDEPLTAAGHSGDGRTD